MKVTSIAAALCCLLSVSALPASAGERHTLVIGAGEVTGYYFPAAGALCRVINKEHPRGFTCAAAPSSGSAANVATLKSGETDFAILQSRAAVLASTGGEGFRDGAANPDLRAVMSLHGEAVAILARQGSGIETPADLKGKRVNLGRPGSFQRAMAEMVLEALGLSEGDLSPAVELDLAEETAALCEGNIDAAFFTGVHPIAEAIAAVDECNAGIVPIKGKTLDAYLKRNPWMSRATLHKGTYDGVNEDVPSLQLKAVLATTTRVPAEDVYDVLKAIYANFPALTRLHPVLKGLNKAEAAKDGIAIKLHDGAEKFYAESGLNK
ncbi:MAG TPA: TAXI family TRAP transporter solute-binding subunit [Magnetospirillum sp.]|nr:TAXI family TRAP transporter solute-binding subunit [Magnetospirillum sp.]